VAINILYTPGFDFILKNPFAGMIFIESFSLMARMEETASCGITFPFIPELLKDLKAWSKEMEAIRNTKTQLDFIVQ
jgi:hypothetical protein